MCRMQREAPGQGGKLCAVEVIAGNRAADMRKMHADLMRAPGFKAQAQQRAATAYLLDAVMRHGALSVIAHGAACACAKAHNRRVDYAFLLAGNALGHGEIFANKAAGVQLLCQQSLRVRMPRDAQKAAGPLVEPVDGMVSPQMGHSSSSCGT